MQSTILVIVAIVVHATLFASALYALHRANAYTRSQKLVQAIISLFLPVLGAILVIIMAKEAVAPFPKADESKFDKDPFGAGS